MKLLALLLLLSSHSWADSCPDKPVGFGFSSLEELNNSLKNSYSVVEHCQQHKNLFQDFKNQKSDANDMANAIEKSRLIILGEEHLTPSQRNLGQLFSEIKMKNNRINCLFLEFHPNNKAVKALIEGGRPDSYIYLQHFELVTSARSANVKIFAVDGRDPNRKTDSDMSIKESNQAIFKNIKKLFDSNECDSGVLLIGKAHVEHPQIQIDPKDSIKTFFSESNYSTTAINLVYTGKNVYRDNIDQQWNWSICKDDLFTPLKTQISIGRKRLNEVSGMVVFPVKTFDYYLFLPEVEEKRLYP